METGSNNSTGHDLTKLHLWQIQWVRDLFLIVIVVCGIWLGYAMRDITIPLLVALLLAYLFEPLISFLADHPKFPLGRIPVISGILILLSVGVLTGSCCHDSIGHFTDILACARSSGWALEDKA